MLYDFRMLFRKVSPAEIAAKDLYEAEIELLKAYSHREYAMSLVSENEARVSRLRGYLAKLQEE